MKTLHKRQLAIAAGCGLMAGGIFSAGLSILLLPLLLALFFAVFLRPKPSLAERMWIGCVLYFCFIFVVLSWFLDINAEVLAGLNPGTAPLLLLVCLSIMSLLLAVAFVPFIYIVHKSLPFMPRYVLPLFIAACWVLVEWLRSIAFSLILIGDGASIGDYWNFGSFGLALIDTPLGYAARLVGMYGLSFLVVWFSTSLVLALQRKQRMHLLLSTAAVLIFALGGYFLPAETTREFQGAVLSREGSTVDLYQPDIPVRSYRDTPKDIIALPEYSGIYAEENDAFINQFIEPRLDDVNGISIDAEADFAQDRPRFNTLVVRDSHGASIDEQPKQLLIPTGEFMPYVLAVFFNITGQSELVDGFNETRSLSRGTAPETVRRGDTVVGPVACSGILGRNIYRNLSNGGAELLTNSASLIVFAESEAYYRQSLQMARFHAVANSRPFIQSSTAAPSFVVGRNGEFVVEPEDVGTYFTDFIVTSSKSKTPYTQLGEIVPILSLMFVVLLIARQFRPRKNK